MQSNPFATIPFLAPFGGFLVPLFVVLVIWELIIKGFALWRAARNGHKGWFVFILILNTVGILPLVYIIWFSKPQAPAATVSSTPQV